LVERTFNEGDKVKKGQLLARWILINCSQASQLRISRCVRARNRVSTTVNVESLFKRATIESDSRRSWELNEGAGETWMRCFTRKSSAEKEVIHNKTRRRGAGVVAWIEERA